MKALFCVDTPHETHLNLTDIQGEKPVDGYGYWIAENTEAPPENTVMVVVNTTDEMLDQMAADDSHMKFIKDLPDET